MVKMEGEKERRWVADRWWIFGGNRSFSFSVAVRSGGEQKRKKEKERTKKKEKERNGKCEFFF